MITELRNSLKGGELIKVKMKIELKNRVIKELEAKLAAAGERARSESARFTTSSDEAELRAEREERARRKRRKADLKR